MGSNSGLSERPHGQPPHWIVWTERGIGKSPHSHALCQPSPGYYFLLRCGGCLGRAVCCTHQNFPPGKAPTALMHQPGDDQQEV